jgi:hydroxyacylglutathione hydrolase
MKTHVERLTFNPFSENTYILVDESTRDCAIIDPGCMDQAEEEELVAKIEDLHANPVLCLNTHCHIDHILGNWFVFSKYGLKPWIHQKEIPVLEAGDQVGAMYGLPYRKSPDPIGYLVEDQTIKIGETHLQSLFTPGHSPGSISFYCEASNFVIGGDVLFLQSIGRTDLPGGHHDTLIRSINEKIMVLHDNTTVFPGHGPETTVGYERLNNPFLR